jgi:BirA family transcriptional regulator, biotin operon repressor / biotin---[acetyl-CoA-carboxylase] ligase
MFSAEALKKGLRTRQFGQKIYTFDTIDSTNNCARALAGCWADEGTVIIAEQQTAGRGRLGRPWVANANENLTFSIILRPTIPADTINLLPLAVAVAVAEAVEKESGLKLECKWPNDLIFENRKVARILLEGSFTRNVIDWIVIGIGINVNQTQFPGDLADKASSLKLSAGRDIDRSSLFHRLLESLERCYKAGTKSGFESILPEWISRTTMIDRQISVMENGTLFSGTVKGLSRDGGLILRSNGLERTLFAGDVTILGQ